MKRPTMKPAPSYGLAWRRAGSGQRYVMAEIVNEHGLTRSAMFATMREGAAWCAKCLSMGGREFAERRGIVKYWGASFRGTHR